MSDAKTPDKRTIPDPPRSLEADKSQEADKKAIQDPPRRLDEDSMLRLTSSIETIALASPSTASPSGAGLTGGRDLARIAEESIARLLGAPANGAPEQLLARLEAVFPSRVEQGNVTYTYRPVGAQPLDGPSGALVGGAQAALYQQARVLGGSIHALLDGLVPVITDPDKADIASLIASYRETTDSIVDEFGREGGALLDKIRVAQSILDSTRDILSQKLGLKKGSDPDDQLEMELLQQDLIRENMEMLEELTRQLTGTLVSQYDDKVIKGVSARYTRLAWTIRAMPATIEQVRAEFDALRISAPDRMLMFVPKGSSLSIEQILQWCEMAGTSEWPRRLVAGRRADFDIIRREAKALHTAVSALPHELEQQQLFGIRRLQAALLELRGELESIVDLASVLSGKTKTMSKTY